MLYGKHCHPCDNIISELSNSFFSTIELAAPDLSECISVSYR